MWLVISLNLAITAPDSRQSTYLYSPTRSFNKSPHRKCDTFPHNHPLAPIFSTTFKPFKTLCGFPCSHFLVYPTHNFWSSTTAFSGDKCPGLHSSLETICIALSSKFSKLPLTLWNWAEYGLYQPGQIFFLSPLAWSAPLPQLFFFFWILDCEPFRVGA